ncbi:MULTISPECIES: biopolymer transporter ExbD [Ponticaulis]|jgi:biopolymer transport protein ExbD|uniref:ExbD/TolR family protein n=1 Tax=Ponticaulis TaxID=1123044 RepID=UPI0003B3CFE1|nr:MULTISPECIES: biopolymer transporter ExbD [Ponticaulis]RPG17553.1 MAG: biopolymer transporter ExbD [Hyphomonadaceae bacterium TMED125]HBJ92034.1 biopolymer transporter ExbD [Hyphomonadaceae bacterium]MAJ08863.1 biopolymer transporter ExbD [Ponticaulis sp.]MBN05877.1 biopolymer transporter ExbD [Ponticaulis sp.]MDF1681095.1 biopolymer transporter ExbD [Ponticaulis sp.]|tara:strand:- start:9491 stop:9898 length:408 start_codon:yes stop_codon:yes gene_type:complete
MRGRKRKAEESEVDLTPMLDIVFILLIFFIVTATFIKENAIDLTPPPPAPPDQPVNPQPTVLIRITEDSLVTVNGRLSDVGSVRAAIERRIAENPESAVLVQAHPRARNQLVIMIVDQARSAGIENVGFTVDATA